MALYLGDKLISSNLAGGDTNPIGSVIAFAGSNAPVGYLMCDGSAVSREIYADLFAVIGTTYGSGDGSTTFNLPQGNNQPHNNLQPFLALNYIIKATHNVTIQGVGTIGEDEIVEKKTLLWTNPNPSASFEARTIGLDLSGYEGVEIFYRNSTDTDDAGRSIKSEKCIVGDVIGLSGLGSTESQRLATVTTGGVSFGNGTYANAYGGAQISADSVIIPQKIYGIKHI